MRRTTTPIRQDGWHPQLMLFAAVSVGAAALILGSAFGWPGRRSHPVAEIGTAVHVEPIATLPAPTAVSAPPLRLSLALPELDQDQAYWHRVASVVTTCPLCAGIDQPAIDFEPNALTTWLALIWTESRYQPWAVSSAGCQGLGQLCGLLDTPETQANPALNLYESAREFARLIDANGGDYMAGLRQYKGVTSDDTTWQANSVFDVLRLEGAK